MLFAITAELTVGAVTSWGETVKAALACEPPDPTAYTVCAPAAVSTGIVTLTGEAPLNGIGEFVTLAERTAPVTGLSSRNTIVSPVTKLATVPEREFGSVASVVGGPKDSEGGRRSPWRSRDPPRRATRDVSG